MRTLCFRVVCLLPVNVNDIALTRDSYLVIPADIIRVGGALIPS